MSIREKHVWQRAIARAERRQAAANAEPYGTAYRDRLNWLAAQAWGLVVESAEIYRRARHP